MEKDDDDIEGLIAAARRASACSYSPYSKFPVGAAVLDASGEVFAATNVENASFGLTICAERAAIFAAVAAGRRDIQAIVVYTPTEAPAAPCGACRQVINEFNPKTRVVSACDSDQRLDATIDELLPHAFRL